MNSRSLSKTKNQTTWRPKTNFDYLMVARLVALVIIVFVAQSVASAQGPPDQVISEHALGNSPFADQLSGEGPVTVTGILTVLHGDDFANKRSKNFYYIKDSKTKETYQLRFAKKVPGHLRSGATVKARGRAKGGELYLALDESGQESLETLLPAQVKVAGEQKTLVMVANFLDASLSCSVDSIEDLMFTDPVDNSVDDLYTETSFGEIWLTGQVVGPYTIDYTKDVCNVEAWANAADAVAQAEGVDTGDYSRKVYVLPPSACPGSGYGTVGGNPSRAWIFTCHLPDVFAHELGHNLGMGHAATPSWTYGDTSDVMGLGGGPLRQINAPHKEQMGWLPPEQVAALTENGVYNIAPLELDPFEAPAPQALKIFKPDTNEYYYLSYRRPIGFDANLAGSRYLDHLNVHRYIGDGSGSRTYALNTLADGESFIDSINNISITQISHSDAYVTVQVQMDATCVTAEPVANISPASQSAAPGSTLTYTVTVFNADSANCTANTFSLDAVLPNGWTGTVSPDTLDLQPGQSGTATLSVTSPGAAAEASYGLTVNVTDAAESTHTASTGASYVVELACIPGTPIAGISPPSQSAVAGTTLDYTITANNTDSANCASSTFSIGASLPAGWTGSISPDTLTLSPGQTGTATLSVTSPAAETEASYGFSANVTDPAESLHTSSAMASYIVESIDNADTEAPSVPTGLKAEPKGKNIKLTWNASTDNVGVSGYAVWRDGARIADTTETAYVDKSAPSGSSCSYSVSAYDAAGNMSPLSSEALLSFTEKTNKGKPPKN
jgi:uncharacterized repeat protein (TIGR01451 family)